MTTEEQLEKVEKELAAVKRQVRRLVIAGAVGVGCFVILLAVSAVSARPVGVRARKFVLVDEKGKTRALLAVDEAGPKLDLADVYGKTRVELCVRNEGPVLNLSDQNGNARAALSVLKDGPVLDLDNGNGKTRALLTVEEGGPGMRLFGEKDKVLWSAP